MPSAKGAGSNYRAKIEGLSWDKYNALTGLPWGSNPFKSDEEFWRTWKRHRTQILAQWYIADPFKSDEEFWRTWKRHRTQILAQWYIARRPYAYWLEVPPEDEPFPVWHVDQAYMLRQLGLYKNQAERDEVDKILAAVRCDMDAR